MNIVERLTEIVAALDELKVPHLVMAGTPFGTTALIVIPPVTTFISRLMLEETSLTSSAIPRSLSLRRLRRLRPGAEKTLEDLCWGHCLMGRKSC